jgi:Na+/H+ antiporter NhaD/arsenite permease-like protein
MGKIKQFLHAQAVPGIAAVAAAVSSLFVLPSALYFTYPDYRVLALLFCLMAIIAGITNTGAFIFLSRVFIARAGTVRRLSATLIALCFFFSMLITNDVALLTFVPFAITVLTMGGLKEQILPVVVLQTAAANLGSILTPVGNPQNLYLYAFYAMTPARFFSLTGPPTLASFILIAVLCRRFEKKRIEIPDAQGTLSLDKIRLAVYCALFLLCLLTVFGQVPYPITLAVTALAMLGADRKLFLDVNYSLLLTFVCFFVFVGNMSRIGAVQSAMALILTGREFFVSIAVSQIISNVPAAIMLSSFTQNGAALVAGTNIGGLGTLVASLASLISYRLYCESEGARPARYLAVFTLVNVFLLTTLTLFWLGWTKITG